MKRLVLSAIAFFAFSATANAQTGPCPTSTALVVNPQWVCVAASVDHAATDPLTGQPAVTRYDLLFFAPGVDTAIGNATQTIPVGKPTPNAQNAMWLQRAELQAIPLGQQYKARAVAVGPGGTSARSGESNPFGRSNLTAPAAPGQTSVVGEQ
jgi:hypothetical protein